MKQLALCQGREKGEGGQIGKGVNAQGKVCKAINV